MIRETHIDTRRLEIDNDLRERLARHTSQPTENGCTIYREGKTSWSAHIDAYTHDGELVTTSVLRVAFVVAGLGHVAVDEEIGHACGHTDQGSLCICPDHLVKLSPAAARRERERARHLKSLRKALPNYQENRA